MPIKANESVVFAWLEAWLEEDLAQIEKIFAANYTVNDKPVGIDGVKQVVQLFHSGLSDISIEVNEMVSDDDKVAVRWTVRGIHSGNFLGIASTGNPLTLTGINIYQIADGKIVANKEQTNIPEHLQNLQQQK